MSILYTFNSSDEYWHDSNSYSEIGELHSTKSHAVVGKIPSRYSTNKKKSTISPDSDRLLYNYFSNPDVKDYAIVEETLLADEKQVFVGSYFIAIYDSKTGNFVCENPKSFLKDLVNPISEGGLGYEVDENDKYLKLSAEDFDSVCANMKYAITEDEYVYVISSLKDGRNVMFRINPFTYEVSNYHASGFLEDIGPKMIYCKPFTISSNIYFICYNRDKDALECYCVSTYGSGTAIYGYSSVNSGEETGSSVPKTIVNGIIDLFTENTKIENSIIALSDEKKNNGTVFFFATNPDLTKVCRVYDELSQGFKTSEVKDWPSLNNGTSGDYFVEYELFNDKIADTTDKDSTNTEDESTSNHYIYITLLTKSGYFISRTPSTTEINGGYAIPSNGKVKGFYRSILKTLGTPGYRYFVNLLCELNDGSKKWIYPKDALTLSANFTIDTSYSFKSAILETYSDNIYIKRNIFNPNGSNLIIGYYEENGKRRPLIKDVGNEYGLFPEATYASAKNYIDKATADKTFRKGLEAENGVSLVKNISFGNTQITRVRLTPESAAEENPIIQFEDADIYMREGYTTVNDFTDGKYTTGSFLWKMLAKTGIPYNTHVQSVGRIILDGKDIPVENVLITPPETELGYGNVLLTIDKLFDTNTVTEEFTKNGKALYPGILFQASTGFLNDAVISNVYNVDRSFAYNDTYRGKLLDSNDDCGFFEITASCIVNSNDNQYLLVSSFGKLSSINLKTGGFTKFDGSEYGEDAPGYSLNLSQDLWVTHGNICLIIQHRNAVYLFYETGYIYKATIDAPASWSRIENDNAKTNDKGKEGVTRVYARYGDVIVFATNDTDKGIEMFDLDTETVTSNNKHVSPSISSISSNIVAIKEKMYFVGYSGSTPCLFVFNAVSSILRKVDISSEGINGNICYDGNDRLYIVSSNGAVSYYSIEKDSITYSTGKQSFTISDNSVPEYTVIGEEETLVVSNHKYKINKFVWEDYSYTAKETCSAANDRSIIYNKVKYDFETTDDGKITVTNVRDTEESNLVSSFNALDTGTYITALGFTYGGRVLIVSYSDGSIGSYDIPFNKYTSPEYEEVYKVKKSIPKVINPVVKTSSDSIEITPEYKPVVTRLVLTATKHNEKSVLTTINSGEYKADTVESLINLYAATNTPSIEDEGYVFDHWSLTENGPELTADDLSEVVSGGIDYTYYEVFVDNVSTLEEMLLTGTSLKDTVDDVKTKNALGKEYQFDKWVKDEDLTEFTEEELNEKYDEKSTAVVYLVVGNHWALLQNLLPKSVPEYSGKLDGDYKFDHWSLTEDGEAITSDELSEEEKYLVNTTYTVYAVFKDTTESLINLLKNLEDPVMEGCTFAYWSLDEDGEAIDYSTLEFNVEYEESGTTVYAVFFDTYEPFLNRSIVRVFAKAGEFFNEGATNISQVGDDVIISTPTKSIRWAANIGVFFKGRDDKYTGKYVESDKGYIKNNEPVTPLPICDAGVCSIGKYIIYINGYNKFAELPTLTAHNGVIVYDTEYDEYAVMYSGENSLRGTRRQKIKTFCYAYDDYIYEFGGLERVDEHVGKDNFSIFRRTAKIEEIDIITGKVRELSGTFGTENEITGYEDVGIDSDGNTIQNPIYTKIGSNEIRHLTRIGNELKGYISMGPESNAVNGHHYSGLFSFNLDTKVVSFTPSTDDTVITHRFTLKDGSEASFNFGENDETKRVFIPIPTELKYTFNSTGNPIDFITVEDGVIKTYIGNTESEFEEVGEFKFDTSVLNLANDKYQYAFRIPQVLPDGSLYIECEPTHNTNSNKEDSIVYKHLILKDTSREKIDGIDNIPCNSISNDNVRTHFTIDGDLYTASSYENKISVEVYEKEYKTASVESLSCTLQKCDSIKAVICNEVVAIFAIIGNKAKLFTYDYTNKTIKERSTSSEIEFVNGEFRFDYYFNSIIYLGSDGKVKIIRDMTNESHNANNAISIDDICDFEVTGENDSDFKFDKATIYAYISYDDKFVTKTINCNDSGIAETVYTKESDILLGSKNVFHSENESIVEYIETGSSVSKYSRPIPDFSIGDRFNSYTLCDKAEFQYVTNDGKYVYSTTNEFKEVFKTSIETGYTEKIQVNSSDVSDVRDIAALDEVVYAVSSSGDIYELDTTLNSLNKLVGFVSSTLITSSLKMCSNNVDKFIYAVKKGRIYRYNPSGKLIKLYEGIDFTGEIINVRYIEDIGELRIITVDLSLQEDVNSTIYIYGYNFTEGKLRTIGTLNKLIPLNDTDNICQGKYALPANFDDNGNIYVFGNFGDGNPGTITVFDGNTMYETSNTVLNDSGSILTDVSIANDYVYLLSKRNVEDDKIHLVKAMKPFNHIKASRRSFAIGGIDTSRMFIYNSETYVYGVAGYEHQIMKFNDDTLKLEKYSNGPILDSVEFEDENVIGIKAFISGLVYIIGISKADTGKVKITSIGYDLKSKSVDTTASAVVELNGLGSSFKVDWSGQGNWSSHLFTTVLHAEGSERATSVTIDIYNQENSSLTSIVKVKDVDVDDNSALTNGGALAHLNGKVITVGGTTFAKSSENKHYVGSEFSAIHNISREYYSNYEDSDFGSNATIIKAGTHLKILGSGKIMNIGSTGVTPFVIERFNDVNPCIETNSGISLKSSEISSRVIPCSDDTVIVDSGSGSSEDSMSSNARVYQFPSSPAMAFEKNGFGVHVYSGITKDIFISVNLKTNKIIHKVEVERDYGASVKSILDMDEKRMLVIHSDTPAVSTLFIHDNGYISFKRYDGAIFGKTIDTGSNVHSIQEVDLTLLFDEEMSEIDFRTVEGINAD